MPGFEYFQRGGFFLVPGYLNDDISRRLRNHIRTGAAQRAEVDRGGLPYLDPAIRRTTKMTVPAREDAQMREYMGSLRPWVERHFRIPLLGFESLQYLLYLPGDFFGRHIDGANPYTFAALPPGSRKVSVVIFLNQPCDQRESGFSGGELKFFAEPGAANGVALPHVTGLLAAFPSHIPHEITPVLSGERFSAVTWFY